MLSRRAQVQRDALRKVPATLLQPAVGKAAEATPAQLRLPDGRVRTGLIAAPRGAAAGSTVMVWVNQAGDLADPPMGQAAIADRTEVAQGSAAAVFAVGLAMIGRQARHRLRGRQLAA